MTKTKTPQGSLGLFDDPPEKPAPAAAPAPKVWEVRQLAAELRQTLEAGFRSVWVQGELSNFRNPTGHWYFTLKDADAQVSCVMFKGRNQLVRPTPREGDAVLLRGQVSFYERQGKAQIIVEHMEPAGEGRLLRAFEELKKRLAAEGLFDAALKREIPAMPRTIGIITSPTGAALQDMLTTLRRRFPIGSVCVYPVPVQGDAAAPAIIEALARLPKLASVDVVILARGGGSLEDLWAFNDEGLARAIRACPVPVVSGVGHETDFTIADLAADLRAATPTGAAELVSPDAEDWKQHLHGMAAALRELLEDRVAEASGLLERIEARFELVHPGRRLEQHAQRLDEVSERLARATPAALRRLRESTAALSQRLQAVHPARQLDLLRLRLASARERMIAHLSGQLRDRRSRVKSLTSLLNTLGPQAVLERGYAIAQSPDGLVLSDAARLREGDAVHLTLARGKVRTRVVK